MEDNFHDNENNIQDVTGKKTIEILKKNWH